ncbi:hypothetical protein BJX63DRAFT_278766 [Aspergillus granulosus]|uniref:DUF7730 domain-containing protein n=1 Tax=Aspergillus granulosus TaxID=176169 RepID=A0ABR4H7V3_9EURO
MVFDSFIDAIKSTHSLNPLTIYRVHRNPLHLIFLLIYYLILPITWAVRAIRGLAIHYHYPSIYPKRRIDAIFPPLPKTSANGKDDLPPPLTPRKRQLTLPLPDEAQRHRHRHRHRHGKQVTFLQHQSPLFVTFPAEVRRMVYLEVILLPGRGELCVSHAERRLYGFAAMEREEENPDLLGYPHSAWVGLNYAGWPVPESIPRLKNSRPPKAGSELGSVLENSRPNRFRVLGLLTSCRQIYSEVIDLLYTKTLFNVRCPSTMLSLKATTLPQRFQSIRYLHVEKVLGVSGALENGFTVHHLGEWKKACAVIGSIRDLRRLRVSFSRTHCEPSQSALLAYMNPLLQLRAAEFVVRFNWPAHAIVDPILSKWQKEFPFKVDVHPARQMQEESVR